MIFTTLRRIRAHDPCASGWKTLVRHLGPDFGHDTPLAFSVILESNGLDDALWALRAEPQHAREYRLFAVQQARKVQHLAPGSEKILDVCEAFAEGHATAEELAAARDAARGAARDAAWDAARDAVWDAAWDAARDAAWDAAREDFAAMLMAAPCSAPGERGD